MSVPHPRALAHLGDAVYELWVREAAIALSDKSDILHRYTTNRVKAATQSQLLETLFDTLPPDEQAIVKRARNLPVPTGRRSNQGVYRQATAFEALVGYWYLFRANDLPDLKAKVLARLDGLLNEKGIVRPTP